MGIYDELGVKKVINGYATLTRLGGSIMPPQVVAAMVEAAQSFVDIEELHKKVRARIAEWTQNEAAFVSCGAAAGLALSTAACIAGLDPDKRVRLPRTEGMANEVIVHRHGRVSYDFAVQQVGARLVEIGNEAGTSAEEMEAAITEKTAAVLYFYKMHLMEGQVPLEQAIEIGKRKGIPLIVDAAAQIPPVESLWRFTHMGADLVLFSGGKGLRGPQSSGLILGRKDLIEACAFHASPRPFIGRPMKVGKEELVGLMTAVRWTLDQDQAVLMADYEEQVQTVIDAFDGVPYADAKRSFPSEAGQPMPRAEIALDVEQIGFSRDEVLERLQEGDPSVFLAPAGSSGIYVNPQTLGAGEVQVVVECIKRALNG